MKTVAAIIQARMTSTRLPGKVMKEVLGRPLLTYQLERIARAKSITHTVLATTTNETDDCLVRLAESCGIGVYRGSEHDVLERYQQAAQTFGADTVVRLTADCPLIDPAVIDRVVLALKDNDYVANVYGQRTFPRGLDTEVFTGAALQKTAREAKTQQEREHVTPYLYNNPQLFRLAGVLNPKDLSHFRWTVDTPEDFELISAILEGLYPKNPLFSLDDIIMFMDSHPRLFALNCNVQQKY